HRASAGRQRRPLLARAGLELDAVGGVRRADHDPGVPAPGPAGRGDGGSSMRQDLSDAWYRLPVAVRRGVVPIAVLALFIFYPEYVDQLSAQWFPQMGVMVQMCVF